MELLKLLLEKYIFQLLALDHNFMSLLSVSVIQMPKIVAIVKKHRVSDVVHSI